MATECKFKNGMQVFSSTPQMISAGGNVTSNQVLVSSATETAMLSETIYANTLDATSMCFRVWLAGEISGDAAKTLTLTLRYGTTDILALATGALAANNDEPFKCEFTGHILTAGASGFIVATAFAEFCQTTATLRYATDTANTGTAVTLTADGSLNVTAHWSGAAATADINVTHGWIEFYN